MFANGDRAFFIQSWTHYRGSGLVFEGAGLVTVAGDNALVGRGTGVTQCTNTVFSSSGHGSNTPWWL